MGPTQIKVSLPPALVAQLQTKPRGTGGFQVLVLNISQSLNDSVLEVDEELRERIEHYAYDFGSEGSPIARAATARPKGTDRRALGTVDPGS